MKLRIIKEYHDGVLVKTHYYKNEYLLNSKLQDIITEKEEDDWKRVYQASIAKQKNIKKIPRKILFEKGNDIIAYSIITLELKVEMVGVLIKRFVLLGREFLITKGPSVYLVESPKRIELHVQRNNKKVEIVAILYLKDGEKYSAITILSRPCLFFSLGER